MDLLNKTRLMGILNITPDSFFSDSRAPALEQAIERALQLQSEGADLLDIGGESSRPGAMPVSEEEELVRVIPVIERLKGHLSIPISIDTMKPKVAQAAIKAGATLINDISGFCHPDMIRLAKEAECDICVMHMQGNPLTMQHNPHYEGGIVAYLKQWFQEKIELLTTQGIKSEKIILDPGIGFGKTVADNLEIIHNLPGFKKLGFRLLLGVSRKSFLGKILDKPTNDLLPATLTANTLAVLHHVDMIRVHDVKEHRSMIDFLNAYQEIRS
jgi:dihydropteroate synthase